MSDWLDQAEDQLAATAATQEKRSGAETWKPSEGDILKGTLIDGDYIGTQHGDTHVLTIEDADEKVWTVWCSGALLKDAVLSQAPMVGKGISIKLDGKKPPKKAGGYEWNAYYMACEESDHPYWHQKMAGHQAEVDSQTGGRGLPTDGLSDPF